MLVSRSDFLSHLLSALPRLVALFALCGLSLTPGQAAEPEPAFLWTPGAVTQPGEWYVSNFTIKKESFLTDWNRNNVRMNDGALELVLRPSRGPADSIKPFIGAEMQRQIPTLYGRYEVVMTAAKGHGVISSLFTYTGPHFGDQHDEIDFEFLGRDTTKVWLNRFVDGEKLPGQWLDLGFDSAEGPHLYVFEWTPEHLVWTIDGREYLRITAEETALPVTPSRVYINIWAGGEGQANWSGAAPPETNAIARYYCMSHQPMGRETPQCSDTFTPSASE